MTAALAKALVEAQKAMPVVDKTGTSNFGVHLTLDHLITETKKHLADHGLSIVQFPSLSETGQPTLRTTLIHESGESLSADAPLFLGDRHTMQALGAALTYARRQAWSAVLGISTEADDDGDSVSLPDKTSAGRKTPPARPAADHNPPAAGTTPKAPPAGTDGQAAPAGGAPVSAEDLEALYELVREKGGDVGKTQAGAFTAVQQEKLPAWYAKAKAYWEAQPKSYANKVPAKAKAAS